jgi:hypothetical protein
MTAIVSVFFHVLKGAARAGSCAVRRLSPDSVIAVTVILCSSVDLVLPHEDRMTSAGLVFKTTRVGRVTLAFALTRGETAQALESRTFKVLVK